MLFSPKGTARVWPFSSHRRHDERSAVAGAVIASQNGMPSPFSLAQPFTAGLEKNEDDLEDLVARLQSGTVCLRRANIEAAFLTYSYPNTRRELSLLRLL